jgi:hypothetical protein
VKFEPQTSIAQPGNAWVHSRFFEFRIEVGQKGGGSRLVFKPIDADLNQVSTQLHPSLNTVDELAVNEFRGLLLIGGSEVIAEVGEAPG